MWKFFYLILISVFLSAVPAQALKCPTGQSPEQIAAMAEFIFIGQTKGTPVFIRDESGSQFQDTQTEFRVLHVFKGPSAARVQLEHIAGDGNFRDLGMAFEAGTYWIGANKTDTGIWRTDGCTHANINQSKFKKWLKKSTGLETAFWQAVWVEGFFPEAPIYGDRPFDWSRAILKTQESDPRDWRSFSAGCNGVSRKRVSRRTEDYAHGGWLQISEWSAGVTQTACTELAGNGVSVALSRAMLIENHLMELVKGIADNRLAFEIDKQGHLIWIDVVGTPVAKFKPVLN